MKTPQQPPSPSQLSDQRFRVSEMEIPQIPQILEEQSTVWDWGNLLDFTVDDQLNISWSPEDLIVDDVSIPSSEIVGGSSNRESDSVDGSERTRKRDPRLTCENFLAGRLPCSCPELDEKDEEEGEVGKKRARVTKVGIARCQVPSCEVDISELKGYHKRHRVCLHCANASTVVLDGQPKRYCQQCGKFHILPDFDEGKRSCRRKLERHNKRRRRKSTDFKNVVEKETQSSNPAEYIACDGEAGKDNLCSSNHTVDEVVLESEDGHASPRCSLPSSQNIRGDSVLSFGSSGETQTEGGKDNSKCTLSSFWDTKSAYSSMCPTGRISFKLYDWNPAEFPRRLRHQIFQWLSSMPVELEGYIRPGCIILTVFIAMPRFMWEKLSEDAASYVHDIVSAPESMLFGRGPMTVNVNDMIFRVLKGGTSLMNIKVEMQAPKLHYVHPTCFEAGKPMEFVACGSNLLQPKFRFLVSFAGRYLACDYCLSIPHEKAGLCHGNEEDTIRSCGHQIYKIHVPKTEPNLFGPAFIEVENESGLSNFIPVLFGDSQICSEMQLMRQRFDKSLWSRGGQLADLDAMSVSCKAFELRQTAMSELLLDIAWLLKEPKFEDIQCLLTSRQIQRFNYLLNFLIQSGSTVVLEKVLHSLRSMMDEENLHNPFTETNDADIKLFQKHIDQAKEIVHRRFQHMGGLEMHSGNKVLNLDCVSRNSENDMLNVMPVADQDMEMAEENLESMTTSTFQHSSGTEPLINREVVMNVNHQPQSMKVQPQKSCGRIFSRTIMSPRPLVLIMTTVAVCFGACAVLLHPHKVGEFAVSIRRCLFGNNTNP